MVGMTIGAGMFAGLIEQAVEAGSLFDIEGDLCMAIEAKGTLIATVESGVAGGALRFDLRMTLDHFSRHDECLNAGGVAWVCTKKG